MRYNFMDMRIGWLLLCDYWKETFYLLPNQLDEKADMKLNKDTDNEA